MQYSKMVRSGNILEVYEYEKAPPQTLWGRQAPRKKNRSKGLMRSRRRRWDNVNRLRKTFIRLVRSNLGGAFPPAFVTLTFAHDVPLSDARRCLTAFGNRMGGAFKGYKHIAVPEFQKRGTIHFHLLAWGIPKEIIYGERDYRTLQHFWTLGYVDCAPTDGSEALSGYMAKYMSKAMLDERLRDARAYLSFGDVVRPVLYPGLARAFSEEIFGVELSTLAPLQSRSFSTEWLGEGRYTVYKLEDDKTL